MVAGGRILGALLLVRTRDGGRPGFAAEDARLAEELGRRAALARSAALARRRAALPAERLGALSGARRERAAPGGTELSRSSQ